MRKSIRKILSGITGKIAPAYIAGPEIEDAINICRQIDRYGWRSTICPWDSPDETPELVAANYQKALHAIRREKLDCYLSIKVPSLKFDFEMLKELFDIASDQNTRIHFDALSPDTASSTFAMLEKSVKVYRNLGCTLPSRWKRSVFDAGRAIDMGLAVRIVKGQWPDPDQPNLDPSVHFLELIEILAGRAAKVAVASHDVLLANKSLARLRNAGTFCELEQLFGLPLRIDQVEGPPDTPVRIYIPYGYAYLPYALSEIKKRPIIVSWLIKDIFAGINNGKRFLKSV